MAVVERFAPSPTGPLHLGHAFSATTAYRASSGGRFLLRIEDIDHTRSRPAWEAQIYDDLAWLGIAWEEPVWRQSERLEAYRAALESLWQRGLLYACKCNRRDILAASSAPQEGAAPQYGPDGMIYPGTCAHDPANFGAPGKALPEQAALRLSLARALPELPQTLSFTEVGGQKTPEILKKEHLATRIGDVVLARRELGTSYHLSVVVDDAAQKITHVTRGADLFEATYIHVTLQALLSLPQPVYRHHRLIRDSNGKRLAKRDDARAIAKYRAEGMSPADLLALLGL